VHAALLAIFQEHGAMTRENAMAEVRRLARERRYQRSIY
jgi:sulfite reductase alpha subunit-like flavoprotein